MFISIHATLCVIFLKSEFEMGCKSYILLRRIIKWPIFHRSLGCKIGKNKEFEQVNFTLKGDNTNKMSAKLKCFTLIKVDKSPSKPEKCLSLVTQRKIPLIQWSWKRLSSKNMPFKNFYIFLLTAPYKSLSRNFTRQRIRKFVNYCSSQISANDPEHTLTTLSFNGKYQN